MTICWTVVVYMCWQEILVVQKRHAAEGNLIKCLGECDPTSWGHDDVIKWKHFPCYWPFVRGIHRSPVNSPHKGQWRGALMFTLRYDKQQKLKRALGIPLRDTRWDIHKRTKFSIVEHSLLTLMQIWLKPPNSTFSIPYNKSFFNNTSWLIVSKHFAMSNIQLPISCFLFTFSCQSSIAVDWFELSDLLTRNCSKLRKIHSGQGHTSLPTVFSSEFKLV